MKLSPRNYRVEWAVHGWIGVAISLLLFVIFFCGVFALFRHELEVWQQPALAVAASPKKISFDRMAKILAAHEEMPPGSRVGFDTFTTTRFVAAEVFPANPTPGRESGRLFIDPVTEATFTERSHLADELYEMHFFYRFPAGIEIAGVISVGMLVAVISGLLIHLYNLRRQWWQFRPAMRLRMSSSDAHKALGVFGLPFAILMAWSGAALGLGNLVDSGITHAVFRGDSTKANTLRGYGNLDRTLSERTKPSLGYDDLVARARLLLKTDDLPYNVDMDLLGDENAWVRVHFRHEAFDDERYVWLDATDGRVLAMGNPVPAARFERTLYDLHFADFGGLLIKIMYALLSLSVCAVIVTGTLVWLERRDPTRTSRGNRLLERATVGIAGGLMLAAATFFVLNRLLPGDLPHRAETEYRGFLATWAVALAMSLVLGHLPPRRVASWLSSAAAVLYAGVVVIDLIWLGHALFSGQVALLASEGLLICLAIASGVLGRQLAKIRPPAGPSAGKPAAATATVM